MPNLRRRGSVRPILRSHPSDAAPCRAPLTVPSANVPSCDVADVELACRGAQWLDVAAVEHARGPPLEVKGRLFVGLKRSAKPSQCPGLLRILSRLNTGRPFKHLGVQDLTTAREFRGGPRAEQSDR